MRHEFGALSGRVIEAAIVVHRELGLGLLESIYVRIRRGGERDGFLDHRSRLGPH